MSAATTPTTVLADLRQRLRLAEKASDLAASLLARSPHSVLLRRECLEAERAESRLRDRLAELEELLGVELADDDQGEVERLEAALVEATREGETT